MYLSELFLLELDEKYTPDSIAKALNSCNNELLDRFGAVDNLQNLLHLYLNEDQMMRNKNYAELADFWSVYREFDDIVSVEESRNILLVRLIYIMFWDLE